MRIDQYKTVIREQYAPGEPGDRGDSCADTARLKVLSPELGVDLTHFRTMKGYIRHEETPEDWKETDFTSDQATPLLMAYDLYAEYSHLAIEMRTRLSATYNTGNGDVVSPGLFFLVKKDFHLLGLTALLQAFLFLVPLRWSDAENLKWWQRFQWGGDDGDYLNWIVTLEYLWTRWDIRWPTHLCYRMRSPARAFKKAFNYHIPQPKSDWVMDIYSKHLDEVRRRIGA